MLQWLFMNKFFMPHGHCYLWRPDVLWTHVISDTVTAVAYYSIPLALAYFASKRRDVPFRLILNFFAAFILLCGTTHIVSIITVWSPIYVFEGVVKALTAAMSLVTAFLLIPLIPKALTMRSPAELEAANVRLGEEATRRREAEVKLSQACETALAATRLKSQFLATMSHEIRTPMNGVTGMSELLLHTPLNAEQEEFVNIIQTSGKNLLTIIDDILDFSKIEAGMLKLECVSVDLMELIKGTIALLHPKATAKGLDLMWHIDGSMTRRLRSDPCRLQQVLLNLLGNAIKFTDQGQVLLYVTQTQEMADDVLLHFSIQDTGIGIAESALELFQPFHQADGSMSRKFGGTGLGLAISKQLVNLMGGDIGFESKPGVGSLFWFTARFAKDVGEYSSSENECSGKTDMAVINRHADDETSALMPQSYEVKNGQDLLILLAEDNEVNQQLTLRQLERLGCRGDVVANGWEVLDAIASKHYDIVLMDCQMPDMDGFVATSKILAEDNAKRPYIIAMTANALKGDRERCINAGMDDYLSKPVALKSLWGALSRFDQRKHSYSPIQAGRSRDDAPINMATLQEATGGNPDFEKQLIALYLEQTSGQMHDLKAALERGDRSASLNIAHKACGSSYAVGAMQLAPLLKEMEQSIKAVGVVDLLPLLEKATIEYERLKTFLAGTGRGSSDPAAGSRGERKTA
jgi:signal transduction histidine kinase/response regulator of citrate/malate metabolism